MVTSISILDWHISCFLHKSSCPNNYINITWWKWFWLVFKKYDGNDIFRSWRNAWWSIYWLNNRQKRKQTCSSCKYLSYYHLNHNSIGVSLNQYLFLARVCYDLCVGCLGLSKLYSYVRNARVWIWK